MIKMIKISIYIFLLFTISLIAFCRKPQYVKDAEAQRIKADKKLDSTYNCLFQEIHEYNDTMRAENRSLDSFNIKLDKLNKQKINL